MLKALKKAIKIIQEKKCGNYSNAWYGKIYAFVGQRVTDIWLQTTYHAYKPKNINKQYTFDHRFDNALIVDEEYIKHSLIESERAINDYAISFPKILAQFILTHLVNYHLHQKQIYHSETKPRASRNESRLHK